MLPHAQPPLDQAAFLIWDLTALVESEQPAEDVRAKVDIATDCLV